MCQISSETRPEQISIEVRARGFCLASAEAPFKSLFRVCCVVHKFVSAACFLLLLSAVCFQGAESFLEEPDGYLLTGLWDGRIVRLISEHVYQHVASTGKSCLSSVHVYILGHMQLSKQVADRVFLPLPLSLRAPLWSLVQPGTAEASIYSLLSSPWPAVCITPEQRRQKP